MFLLMPTFGQNQIDQRFFFFNLNLFPWSSYGEENGAVVRSVRRLIYMSVSHTGKSGLLADDPLYRLIILCID